MSKVQKSVEVESSGYDIIAHSAKIIAAVKAAGSFSAASIPADIAVLVAELPAIVGASQTVSADFKESELEFFKGVNLGAYELLAAIKGEAVSV